jgi:hypothetical protein
MDGAYRTKEGIASFEFDGAPGGRGIVEFGFAVAAYGYAVVDCSPCARRIGK